jgi:hypothetical protein
MYQLILHSYRALAGLFTFVLWLRVNESNVDVTSCLERLLVAKTDIPSLTVIVEKKTFIDQSALWGSKSSIDSARVKCNAVY